MNNNPQKIILNFGQFSVNAVLFDTAVGSSVFQALPFTVELTGWGREVYGTVPGNHGEETPVPTIPPGGIAYSRRGSFFCVFFGQDPAWPVDHIGQIDGNEWQQLIGANPSQVTISPKV